MNVYFTEHSEKNLTTIYKYHFEYSETYADEFNDEIIEFIISNLAAHPNIGHVYNKPKGLYRLIFKQRYNIYYSLREKIVFILFVLDGKLLLNEQLLMPGVELPTK